MKCKYRLIKFIRSRKQNPKTWIYLVRTNDIQSALLGTVKYFARWRQYGFFPEAGTVYEKTCLSDIKEFCIELNERQRLRNGRSKF